MTSLNPTNEESSAATTVPARSQAVPVHGSSAMASYSPISTLERQYGGVGKLLLGVHCNAACCVTLQDAWKVQNNYGGFPAPYQTEIPISDTSSEASTQAESNDSAASSTSPDDPFSFLNCTSGPTPLPPSPPTVKKKNTFGHFLKKVAATSTKAIERGMHHLAVKADQGRTPDYIVLGLFDENDTLVSATEPEKLPENKSAGVRFCIPLTIPATYLGKVLTLKLWVRSGAALAASKHYLLAESGPLLVAKLREAMASGTTALCFPVPLNSASVIDGLLQCIVVSDHKFTTVSSRGWSLQDPNPLTAYKSNMFHLPLDQSYTFTLPRYPITTTLLATERTVESTMVLPIAAAFAQLAAAACRSSLAHLQAVSKDVYEYRHDTEAVSEYANTCVRVSHFQSNTASSSHLQNRPAFVSAMFQRPNSIFEVEVMAPVKLPLHPTAAGGLRPDISCSFSPKPVRQGILPSLLHAQPGGRLPPSPGYLLGNVRMQITLPKRKSDQTGATVAENPFDPIPNNAASEDIWECVVALDELSNDRPALPVYNTSGQQMGMLFMHVSVQMVALHSPVSRQELYDSTNNLAACGLVSVTGLPAMMDSIFPALDVDDRTLLSGNTLSPEQQRRRSQVSTMGHFVTHEYLEEHVNLIRVHDCKLLEDRAAQYKKALEASIEPSTETAVSYKERSPRPFRPSSSRSTLLLSGIGFNVHTGSFSLDVIEPSSSDGTLQKSSGAVFHNITSGAPADHARGFSNVYAAKEKAAISSIPQGLKSPLGPILGGLRRLEAARRTLAEEIANQQNILVMNIANYFVEQRPVTPGTGNPVTHVPAGHISLQGMRWRLFESVHCLHHLTWTCAMRRSSVFSQALGIAISSYLSSISDSTKLQSTWPERWTRHGFLVSFEGLLSAAGKELGMIEDASVGIDMLRMVSIVLVPDDGSLPNHASRVVVPHSHYIRWIHLWSATKASPSGPENGFTLQIGIESSYFEQLIPTALKNGAAVRFYPILFEVGVDIFQAATNLGSNMSRTVSSTGNCEPDMQQEVLSDEEEDAVEPLNNDVLVQLNYEAFQKMNAYAQSVSPAAPVQATQSLQTHPLLATLFQHISSSSGKMNHDILVEASGMAQQLGGGACVFCKSGKDRTAMHITYKQSQFARKFRGKEAESGTSGQAGDLLVEDTTLHDATTFRIHGTRLPICEKNVGQAKYAFNSLQTKFMPEALKPPPIALAGFLKGGKVFGGGNIES